MMGHAAVLFVFILSIYWGIWDIVPSDNQFVLGFAFFIAFVNADGPIVKYVKTTVKKELSLDD